MAGRVVALLIGEIGLAFFDGTLPVSALWAAPISDHNELTFRTGLPDLHFRSAFVGSERSGGGENSPCRSPESVLKGWLGAFDQW